MGYLFTNNILELIKEYGAKIAFIGGLNNGELDKEDWSREEITERVEKGCKECGVVYYIPCLI